MYMNDGNKTKISLSNKSVFITGVAGFIGSNLAKRLLSTVEDVKVVGLDNMNHYYDVRLKEARLNELEQFDNFSFVKGNLADKAVIESIFEQYKPEIVVNLGAQAGVRYSITNPDAYVEANLIGFYNILEACRHSYDEGHTPVKHLVYASSSSVYGSNKKVPYSTDDKVDNPVSLYAATKKSNELMAHTLTDAEKRLEIMMPRIIGVNSNCYHGYSIDEALEGIAAAGFHYVELTATKGWTEHVFPDQSFASLCHVQDKLKELDLVPFAMSGHTNLMDADRLPDFIMNMRLAHFFGCKYIVSSIGEAHLKDKAKTGNEVLVQNIKGLIPHLKENGLMLVLELHGEHATGTIMNEIVTAVNSNLVKINYDTANCVFYGNVDAADDIDNCMDNVAYLHIKDKAGARDAWDFPALGKGYVDFKTLFNKLDKANNDAPLSLEIEFTAKGPKDLDEINTAVKESAAYLENLGYKI